MVIPVGCNINKVDVGALANLFVALLATIDVCRGQTGIAKILLASLCTGFHKVAKSYYLYARNVGETFHGTRTSHAKTNECHPDSLKLGSCEA